MLILYDMKGNYPATHEIQARLRNCKSTIHHWWKRCIQESPLYTLGVILQPQYRTELFSAWANTYGQEIITEAREKATTFWVEYQRASKKNPQQPPSSRSCEKKKSNSTEPISILTSKLHALTIAPARPPDQLTDYLFSDLRFEVQKLESHDYKIPFLLGWWYQQRPRWPELTLLAIEILSIAAMSDDVERIFSGARRTISWERSKLGLDKVEAAECLGSWIPLHLDDEVGEDSEEIEEDSGECIEEDTEDIEEDSEDEEIDR